MLEKSIVEKCCRGVLEKSVGEECCRGVLEKSVVQKCCREVLEKSAHGLGCCSGLQLRWSCGCAGRGAGCAARWSLPALDSKKCSEYKIYIFITNLHSGSWVVQVWFFNVSGFFLQTLLFLKFQLNGLCDCSNPTGWLGSIFQPYNNDGRRFTR